jgi:hypothetical protein
VLKIEKGFRNAVSGAFFFCLGAPISIAGYALIHPSAPANP